MGSKSFPEVNKSCYQWELLDTETFNDSSKNMDLLGTTSTWSKLCLIVSFMVDESVPVQQKFIVDFGTN